MSSTQNFFKVGELYDPEYVAGVRKGIEKDLGFDLKVFDSNTKAKYQLRCGLKGCGYCYMFDRTFDAETKASGLIYVGANFTHSAECYFKSDAFYFQRNRERVNEAEPFVRQLVCERYKIYGCEGPKQIMKACCQRLGRPQYFFKEDLKNLHLISKVVKKFDNLVLNIRKENGIKPKQTKKKPIHKARVKFTGTNLESQYDHPIEMVGEDENSKHFDEYKPKYCRFKKTTAMKCRGQKLHRNQTSDLKQLTESANQFQEKRSVENLDSTKQEL